MKKGTAGIPKAIWIVIIILLLMGSYFFWLNFQDLSSYKNTTAQSSPAASPAKLKQPPAQAQAKATAAAEEASKDQETMSVRLHVMLPNHAPYGSKPLQVQLMKIENLMRDFTHIVQTLQAQSDANGEVTLQVRKNNFFPSFYVTTPDHLWGQFTLNPDDYSILLKNDADAFAHKVFEVQLQQGVLLQGQAHYREDGKPVDTFQVVVMQKEASGMFHFISATGSQGNFELTLKAGPQTLHFFSPDHTFLDDSTTTTITEPLTAPLAVQLRRCPEIKGIVLNEKGLPLALAEVKLFTLPTNTLSNTTDGPTTLTATDGRFTLRAITPGKASLRALATGYLPTELVLPAVTSASSPELRITLQPGGASVSGTITDAAGKAVSGKTVYFSDPNIIRNTDLQLQEKSLLVDILRLTEKGLFSTTSDAAGHYQFASVPTGAKTVFLTRPSLPPVKRSIQIVSGQALDHVDLVLDNTQTNSLTGLVVGDKGPLANTPFTYYINSADAGDKGRPISAKTDSKGRYYILFPKPGNYRVELESSGYIPQRKEILISATPSPDVDFLLQKKEQVLSSVSGILYLADGTAPAPGAMVYVLRLGTGKETDSSPGYRLDEWEGQAVYFDYNVAYKTDSQGQFTFDALPPGNVLLLASPVNLRGITLPGPKLPLSYSGVSLTPATLSPDLPVRGLQLRLTTAGLLRIRIKDTASGKTIGHGDIHVKIATDVDPVTRNLSKRYAELDSTDDCLFVGLLPADYEIEADVDGYKVQPVTTTITANSETLVELQAGAEQFGSISGKVLFSNGTPAPGATIHILQDIQPQTSGTDGSFKFPQIKEGLYAPEAHMKGHPNARQNDYGITVKAGKNTDLLFTLKDYGTLQGTVVRADGSPAASVPVAVSRAPNYGHLHDNSLTRDLPYLLSQPGVEEEGVIATRTDKNGHFAFTQISPDLYGICAYFEQQAMDLQLDVAVQENQATEVKLVVGTEPATLTGTVRGPDGAALPNVEVGSFRMGPGPRINTDANGQYQLQLPSGNYEIYAQAPNLARHCRRNIKLLPGQSQTLDFSLVTGCTLTGTVVMKATGDPVANANVVIYGVSGYDNVSYNKTRTNARGEFTLPYLLPSEHYVLGADRKNPSAGKAIEPFTILPPEQGPTTIRLELE